MSDNSVKMKKKKTKVSKNRKLYWRKHTDTKDVDDFLNEKLLEERLGGSFKDKKDEDLFVIDTGLNNEVVKQEKLKLSKKERARLPPRCLELLKPLTSVPDPIIKRNRVRTKEERKSSIRKAIEERKRLCGIIPKKVLEARISRAVIRKQKKTIPKCNEFKKDLWDCKDIDEKEKLKQMDWINDDTIRHNLTSTGLFKVVVPKGVRKKKSVVSPIELPHPGSSYNPSLKDHKELLNLVIGKELEKQKQEAHVKRVTTDLFAKVSPSQKVSSWIEEMSQGLPQIEGVKTEDSVKEEVEESSEYKPINPPANFLKKKTKQQRKKQKLQKEAELKRKEAKIEKKKVADLYKLRFIKKNIHNSEETQLKNLEKRKKLVEFNIGRTKRLGSKQYEEQDVSFNISSELTGNLRNIKTRGRILTDRFYSLQKRNMLVPSIKRIGAKKAKVKAYVKSSHKMEQFEKNK